MKKIQFKKIISRLLIFVILILPLSVSAGGVDAGSGGGPSVPLYLRDCSMADGQTDVPQDITITLYFSHNVADAAVQKNNRKAISMKNSDGERVSVTISFSSVFEYRQEIYVTPSSLEAGETYILTVSPELMSRNGYTTGTTETITFTTKKAAVSDKNDSDGREPEDKKEEPSESNNKAEKNSNGDSKKSSEEESVSKLKEDEPGKQKSDNDQKKDSSGSDTETSEAIEEQKMKEAIAEGIVEETSEKEIEKVTDRKPGKVENTVGEKDSSDYPVKTEKAEETAAICLLLAGCLIGAQLLYLGMKQYGKEI